MGSIHQIRFKNVLGATCFILILGLFLSIPMTILAQTSFSTKPFLNDLSGWKGDMTKTQTIPAGSGYMRTTKRIYVQKNKTVQAMIITGNTMSFGSGFAVGKNIQTPYSRVTAKTINGFNVVTRYNKSDKSGAVMVMIRAGQVKGAIFMFEFRGITNTQALELAQKFNWSEMKSKV